MSDLMNDELLQEAGIRFLPWQGDNYRNGLKGGRRLLVVGDSNKFTQGDRPESSNWNRYLIEECQNGNGYPFYKKIHRLLDEELAKFCTKTAGDCSAYDFISFYNYLVTDKIKQGSGGQKAHMYKDSHSAMIAVLRELRPTHVLIVHKNVWHHFLRGVLSGESTVPNWEGVEGDFKTLYKYSLDNNKFLAAHIYHPSAAIMQPSSVQYGHMKRVIKSFLNEKPT